MAGDSATGAPLGLAADERPANIPELVLRSARRWPNGEAIRWRRAVADEGGAAGSWASWTFQQLWEQVRATSLGLRALGVGRGDRVVILARSRPEWLLADLGTLALGAVSCPIQPSEPPGRIAAQVRHLAPKAIVVENDHLLHRLRRGEGDPVRATIVGLERLGADAGAARTLGELAAGAAPSPDADRAWEESAVALEPSRLATIVHTMAEDGVPRGAMLTHGNVVHSALAAADAIPIRPGDVILSVLPLSHMFERGANILGSIVAGSTVVFADRAMERWSADLGEVRPTVMCCVPAFFEQLERRARSQVARRPRPVRALFEWALGVGARTAEPEEGRQRRSLTARAQRAIALGLVLAPVRRSLGGRLRFFVSGGAALAVETGRFLGSVGIPVLEGYGLTETAPLVAVNRLGAQRYGTVGPPVAETEIRIDPVNGEVLVRGPQVMLGYLDMPDVNRRLIDADGWFHTGDRGAFDDDGRLQITGRIKDLIVLATGKKVAPGPIERALAASPLIAQAVMVGDGRDTLGVLLVRNGEGPADGSSDVTMLHREVDRITSGLATYERPRRVAVLPRPLSAQAGELGSGGKPIRATVIAHFPAETAEVVALQKPLPSEAPT